VMRDPKERPPAGVRLVSPYDSDARTGKKRQTCWDGYKLHVTETCDPGLPRLVTNVTTTSASVTDFETTEMVHKGLSERGLLPGEHVVDAGYVTAHTLTRSAAHRIRIVGPVLPDTTWQTTTAQGYAATDFRIDWDACRVTCPVNGHLGLRADGQMPAGWADIRTPDWWTPVLRMIDQANGTTPLPAIASASRWESPLVVTR
jgi:hypothetical protein